jgi:hypothetical protein
METPLTIRLMGLAHILSRSQLTELGCPAMNGHSSMQSTMILTNREFLPIPNDAS